MNVDTTKVVLEHTELLVDRISLHSKFITRRGQIVRFCGECSVFLLKKKDRTISYNV